MLGRVRMVGGVLAVALAAGACGGGGGGGGGAGAGAATAPPKATLPADLPIVSCFPDGPFTTAPCSSPIETIYAQVSDNGPFDGVRVTTVGVADCANPREFPAGTQRPTDWYWMVRFDKGGTDYGGFVGTGGKLGVICAPFTGT
jgi:hypothetical protein